MADTIHFDGPCPYLLCLATEPHDYGICPECEAVRYGSISCPTCVEHHKKLALITETAEQIAAARHYAEAMVEQRHWELASYMFGEVARMKRHRAWLEGTIKEGDDDPNP